MKETFKCGKCGCETILTDVDYFTVFNSENDELGTICSGDMQGDLKALQNGGCPICDHWEDGVGNSCTLEGWE